MPKFTVSIQVVAIIEQEVTAESLEDAIAMGDQIREQPFFSKKFSVLDERSSVVGVMGETILYDD